MNLGYDADQRVCCHEERVFQWRKLFKKGRELIKGYQCAGRPTPSRVVENIKEVK